MAKALEGRPTGAAAAAYLAAALGILALAISHTLCEISGTVKNSVHSLGKLWIPGAEGIGPYSGKETIQLAVWLLSWMALHLFLRKKNVSILWSGIIFLLIIGAATTLLWPPVTEFLIHALK